MLTNHEKVDYDETLISLNIFSLSYIFFETNSIFIETLSSQRFYFPAFQRLFDFRHNYFPNSYSTPALVTTWFCCQYLELEIMARLNVKIQALIAEYVPLVLKCENTFNLESWKPELV
ncbi:4727_t:CDS:2 [Dentiscutata heterogama]|uniref:4727_t:CDS:1 n=1 Tax=Dentiscutata heterogama TaxID=1316150 RepID=A0ACA9JXZ5_9GLOM|nr:4727_t:CDS:2 [Dentiscutata heterogama]